MTTNEILAQIKEELILIKNDLSYHIKRTDILEQEFKPIKRHVELINGVCKLFSAAVIVAAALAGIARLFIK